MPYILTTLCSYVKHNRAKYIIVIRQLCDALSIVVISNTAEYSASGR